MLGRYTIALATAAALGLALPAQASLYTNTFAVTASEGLTNGAAFDTANGDPFDAVRNNSNTAKASFTYTGPINFSNTAAQNSGPSGDLNSAFGFSTTNISSYTPAACSGSMCNIVTNPANGRNAVQVANFTTLANFLGSSGSASGEVYGAYYTFDLGVVQAGTVLTITHDDGISLFQGTTRIGTTTSAATSAVTESVSITSTADTILRYSRQNGTPSVLQVSVPEPMSLGLLGAGLAGLGLIRRRRKA